MGNTPGHKRSGATITFDGDEPASVHAEIVAWILSRQNDADMRTPGKSDGGFVVTGRIDGVTVQASTDPDNDKVWSVLAWGDTHPVTIHQVEVVVGRFCEASCELVGGTYRSGDGRIRVERTHAPTDLGDPLLEARVALASVALDDVTYVGLRNARPKTMRTVSEGLETLADRSPTPAVPAPGA